MTKSQNTKNEQQKDLCITSEQLTEQWKKGELPSGWYWVDYYSVDGAVMLEYIPQHNGFGYEEKELVQAVLAPVPSYDEWLEKTKSLKVLAKEYCKEKEENAQLKELLKRAKWWLNEIVKNHRFTPISTAEKALKDLEELEK